MLTILHSMNLCTQIVNSEVQISRVRAQCSDLCAQMNNSKETIHSCEGFNILSFCSYTSILQMKTELWCFLFTCQVLDIIPLKTESKHAY